MKSLLSGRLIALFTAAGTLATATLIDASSSSQVEQLGPLVVPRSGHAATALTDGRVLITGGRDGAGAIVATAEVFDPANETSTAIGVLTIARIDHTATRLVDGRVLIAGGTGATGALTSVEIFDPANPAAGFRMLSATMGTARAGHTATLLNNGTVLIAGGDDAGTAEIFKPTTESFSSTVLAMAAPRIGHTATLFSDDSVLLAGGNTDSMEYFSSVDHAFTLDPQKMTAARTGHNAISLSDTRLLFFGGDTGHTIDEFNTSSDVLSLKATMDNAQSSATLLANGKILVLSSSVAGLYSPDATNQTTAFTAFNETSVPESTALKRTGQTATELSRDKKILVAGGENAQHQPILQVATFNPARVWTDKDDYQPDDPVILSGSGWKPNENVYLYAVDNETEAWTYESTIAADANGGFVDNPYFIVELRHFGVQFHVTALGAQSTMQADVKFTDAGSFDFDPTSQSYINPPANTQFIENVTAPKNNGTFSASLVFTGTGGTQIPSSWVTISPGAQTFATTSSAGDNKTWTVTITVPSGQADGVYTGHFAASVSGSGGPNPGPGTNLTITVDHTPPGPPSTPDLAIGDDTGVSNTDNITNKTNVNIGGNGAEANSTVELFDGSTSLGTTTANGGGNWNKLVTLTAGSPPAGSPPHIITATDKDAAGNISARSGPLSITVDTSKPTVTVNQAQAQSDPTNSAPINFTATFNENVVGFTAADVSVSGNAGGTKTVTVTGTGPTYNIAVGGMTTNGTVIATIPAGVVTDTAGNTNVDSTSTDNSVTFNTQAATSLAVQPASGTYGGAVTLSATLTSAGSGVNGKTITFTLNGNSVGTANTNSSGVASLSNVSLSGINVGSYPTGVGASFAGDTSFSASNGTALLTVGKANATWTTNANSKTYGDPDPNPLTTGSGSGFLAADNVTATYSRAPGETVLGGPYHITATLSPAAVLSNYNITNTGADFTINKKNATWNTDPNSKTYGDSDPTPLTTGSGNGFTDPVTASYARAAGESVAGSPYHITATLSAAAGVLNNYNVTNTGADFTINKKNATWNTDPNSKTYGDSDPTPLATGSGSGFTDPVTATYSRVAGESVAGSPYHITATLSAAAGVLDNYNVTNAGADFTINKRNATWNTDPNSKTYGDTDPVPLTTGSGSNFVDTVTATYTRAAGESVVGGPYHITATLSAAAGVLDNYNVTNAGANFTINTRPATWTTNASSKTYGDMDPSPLTTGNGSNFVATDHVTATYSRVAGETVLGGPYHITANLGPVAVLSNYSITNSGADFTINPRPATVKADNKSKTYGDDNPTLTATVSGTVNSDVLDFSLSTTAVKFSDVGNYTITVTLGSNPNYSITPTNGTLTINKANQTITWADPATITIGTPLSNAQLNATVTGVAGGSAPGALTYTPPAGTVLGAGAHQPLQVDAAATINYNAATKTVYINVNYTFVGFLQPIDNLPIVNSVKAGQTIPVKWQLKDAAGNLINDLGSLAANGLQSVKIACADGTPQDVIEELASPGSTMFRFDGTQFIFNWQTTKSWAGTCRLMTVTLKDGKVYSAQFTFK